MKVGHIIFLMVIANAFAYGIIAGTMVTAVLLAMFRSGIQDVLRGLGDEVLFRRSDNGAPITATQALEMLERGDPDIRDFLQDVVSASIRMLQLRQSRRTPEG